MPEPNWANIVLEFSLINQNFLTADENSRTDPHDLVGHRPYVPNCIDQKRGGNGRGGDCGRESTGLSRKKAVLGRPDPHDLVGHRAFAPNFMRY